MWTFLRNVFAMRSVPSETETDTETYTGMHVCARILCPYSYKDRTRYVDIDRYACMRVYCVTWDRDADIDRYACMRVYCVTWYRDADIDRYACMRVHCVTWDRDADIDRYPCMRVYCVTWPFCVQPMTSLVGSRMMSFKVRSQVAASSPQLDFTPCARHPIKASICLKQRHKATLIAHSRHTSNVHFGELWVFNAP